MAWITHPKSPLTRRLGRDTRGGTAVEFAVIVSILIFVTLAIVEVAMALWQYNATVKATHDGVRLAVQSDPVAAAIATVDGLALGIPAGDPLTVAPFTVRCTQGSCVCVAGDCSPLASLNHDPAAFGAIVRAMRPFLPFLTDAEVARRVFVEYDHVGLGFAGRPGTDLVPVVSVGMNNHTYDFLLAGLFGLNSVAIGTGRATLPAEDLRRVWP